MERRFDQPNIEAERMVLVRFLSLCVIVVVPVGWLGAVAVLSLRKGAPLSLNPDMLALGTLAIAILALALGYIAARAIVLISVPKAVALEDDGIVGDFRRSGWRGAPIQEIRFDDIRSIRKTYLLRIPIVRGRPDFQRIKPIRDSAIFYLSAANMERVRAALETRARQTDASRRGRLSDSARAPH